MQTSPAPTETGETMYTAVIGVADPVAASVVKRLVVEHPRFEAVSVATNALLTVEAAGLLKPHLVLLADDSPGLRGSEVVGEIRHESPGCQVVMIAAGYDPSYLRAVEGVFSAISITDPTSLTTVLDSTAEYFDHPEQEEPERRLLDRRVAQDWSKVFSERRAGGRRDEEER